MLVKKIEAAKMVGVSKATFYNHIKSKNISISDNGKVDISELQRVYGHDNVKTLEQREQEKSNSDNTKRTPESVLKDKIIQLEKELEKEKQERQRERELLTGQVDSLNGNLKDSINQNKELTRAITDQRSEAEKRTNQKEEEQSKKLDTVLEKIQKLEEESEKKKSWWPFSGKKTG